MKKSEYDDDNNNNNNNNKMDPDLQETEFVTRDLVFSYSIII